MEAARMHLLLALLVGAYANSPILFSSQKFRTRALSWDHEKPQVSCNTFSGSPVGTYCVLYLAGNGTTTGEEAQRHCQEIDMALLRTAMTPFNRFCAVIGSFYLQHTHIWLADKMNKPHLLTSDPCGYRVHYQQKDINSQEIVVVCEAPFYYSRDRRCVMFQEGSDEFEYCFFEKRVSADESLEKCTERSSQLLDSSLLRGTEMLVSAHNLVRANLEFWIEMTDEDIKNLTGLFSQKYKGCCGDCYTVRFGPTKPQLFKRHCYESHKVICEQIQEITDNRDPYEGYSDCVFGRSGNFSYCIANDRKFSKYDGRDFCDYLGLELLQGSNLREPHNLYNHVLPVDLIDNNGYLVWEAGFDKKGKKNPGYCTATNLNKTTPETQSLPCSHQLGYICRKRLLRHCTTPTETANNSIAPGWNFPITRQRICTSQQEFTYNESVNFCKKHSMTVLAQQDLSGEEEKLLLKQLRDKSFWVVPSGRGIATYAVSCKSGIVQEYADCLLKHHVVCTSDRKQETTTTTVTLQKCYGCENPSLRLTGVSVYFHYTPHYYRNFGFEDKILDDLNGAVEKLSSSDDFKVLPYFLASLVAIYNKFQTCQENTLLDQKIGATLANIVEKTMLKTRIIKGVSEDQRVRTASCLLSIVEDFALQKNLSSSRYR